MISNLPPGLIVEVLRGAGVVIPDRGGAKRSIRCPLHVDENASAVLFVQENVFHCSVCGSFTAKQTAERLGVPWRYSRPATSAPAPAPKRPDPSSFSAADADRLWRAALEELRDDSRVERNADRLTYLRFRGVEGALDCGEGLIGFLPMITTHSAIASWYEKHARRWSYGLLVPLFDDVGAIVNVQVRACVSPLPEGERKILFPAGSRASGSRFANRAGRAILSGADSAQRVVLVSEGMLDFISLSLTRSSVPVFGGPGTGGMAGLVAPWARGRVVLIGVHVDEPGERAAIETARRILELGGTPKRLRWPGGAKDANDALVSLGLERFRSEMLTIVDAAGEVKS